MNTKNLTHVAFATATMLYAQYCAGQSNVVYYGVNSNALNVVFVDTNLSQKAQFAIVADLRICLKEWGKASELELGDAALGLVGYLENPERCVFYPEEIDFPKGIVNSPNGLALQIPRNLSDAYTNAFVALVSSNDFVNTLTPANISQYILEEGWEAKDYVEKFQESKEFFAEIKLFPPSVLGFRKSGLFPTSRKDLQLMLPGYLIYPDNPDPEWSGFPAIWHNGKWKIYSGDWY